MRVWAAEARGNPPGSQSVERREVHSSGMEDEAADELKIRMYALPAALAIALVIHSFSLGKFLQRTFFSMWLHELGHATAAWFCGRLSFPGPWFTPIAAERSWVFAGMISAALGYGIWLFRESEERPWVKWLLGSLLAVQLFCTGVLSPSAVERFVLFAGDGGAIVFGVLAMASVFVPPGTVLHKGWLRWGLLAIGAATFIDVFSVWWGARTDIDLIPFGQNEGMGLSDPSRLAEDHGWSPRQLVNRYLFLGLFSLAMLVGLNVLCVIRARAAARQALLERPNVG
jgi:hypothetical protein